MIIIIKERGTIIRRLCCIGLIPSSSQLSSGAGHTAFCAHQSNREALKHPVRCSCERTSREKFRQKRLASFFCGVSPGKTQMSCRREKMRQGRRSLPLTVAKRRSTVAPSLSHNDDNDHGCSVAEATIAFALIGLKSTRKKQAKDAR
jgi:hypothetical protein